jgi:death-on-curing protein
VDGDKRTAWAAAEIMMRMNGYCSALTDDQAFDLVIDVATSCSEIEVIKIASALRLALT